MTTNCNKIYTYVKYNMYVLKIAYKMVLLKYSEKLLGIGNVLDI